MKFNKQKLYLILKRDELINNIKLEGYSCTDISIIFNRNKSTISDILNKNTKRDEVRKEISKR